MPLLPIDPRSVARQQHLRECCATRRSRISCLCADVRGRRAREIACAGRRHCIVQHLERCRSRPHAWHPGSSRARQPFRHGAYLHLPIGAVSVLGPHLGRPVRGQCPPQSATPRLPVERASDLPRRSTSRPSSAGAPAAAGLVIDGTPPCSQPWSHGWKPARWGQVCEIPPVTVEMLASQRNVWRDNPDENCAAIRMISGSRSTA
jgi:hypothetical protein